jgi:hypothetical protein
MEALLVSPSKSQPVTFEWWLIRRHNLPFLLLPSDAEAARIGLNLYSAQRWQAKMWRQFLTRLLRTPLAGWFERIRIHTDRSAEFIQFMAQQAGLPADRIFAAAIKLSEMDSHSRMVLLLCDESGRPARVIKAGLNAAGRAAINDEADFLVQLPPGKLGCVRLTGRLATPDFSAFSTDYFPGTSPHDDAGLEHLFHDWLNSGTVPLESLPVWRNLSDAIAAPDLEAWREIKSTLAGKNVRTTLYHGDFAPWNVRVVNSRNLQAFDWERGSHQGIPGWDWFHFITQTAILARRHSAERAAAEVEQLIQSLRFKKYAAAAGISDIVEPLMLAYLLHHIWVTKPSEGGRTIAALFDLLIVDWLKKPSLAPVVPPVLVEKIAAPGLWSAARRQLNSAVWQWRNLFWEPSLNFQPQASWRKEFQAHWPMVLVFVMLLAAIATAQFYITAKLFFLPFYIATCALLAWKAGRRWGLLAAAVAAFTAPLVIAVRDAGYREPEIMIWNAGMRFLILQVCVLFLDRIHKERQMVHHRPIADFPPVKLADNWAVLMSCGLFLAGVLVLDFFTNPQLILLPLYLFPSMMLALVLNARWGTVAALLATTSATWVECLTNKIIYDFSAIFAWNFTMRLAIFLLVLFLIQRIRRENVIFAYRKSNTG